MKKDASLVYETYWELLCHFHICAQITELRAEGIKQMSWASYLFQGLRNKTCLVSRRAVSIDEEIEEIIFASVISHTTKSNEDTFKSDTVFESFHHQARISISGRALLEMDRALLAGFLMLWIKRCVVPTLPYEVLIANVVYPTILLSYGRSLSMLPEMVSCVQGGLWVLTKSFCHVETLEDIKGHIIIDQNGPRKLKILYSYVELPYAYLMAWYVMHCPSLMSVVQASQDFVPFIQKLEYSSWQGGYMAAIRKIIQKHRELLVRHVPDFLGAAYNERFIDHPDLDGSPCMSQKITIVKFF